MIALIVERITTVGIEFPAHGLDLQTRKVNLQFIACICFGFSNKSAKVFVIKGYVIVLYNGNIGIITTTHHLIIYIEGLVEVERDLTRNSHATHITSAEERAEIRGVFYIVYSIAIGLLVKGHTGLQPHGCSIHIGSKCRLISQIQRTVIRTS